MHLLFALFFMTKAVMPNPPKSVYEFTMNDIDGNKVNLADYKGKVLLFVNVASHCGHTHQYKEIEEMYLKYKDQGLVVLGFPANNFLAQEPGSNETIKEFCSTKFHVTFPMFGKISVKGKNIHPLYQYLTEKAQNGVLDAPVKWNFQKFLIGKDGKVITSFAPGLEVNEPEVITVVENALKG